MQERIDIIAQSFGCTSGRIETSPCTGKWRGTSDIFIRLDNGTSLPIGNRRTPQAKTAKIQNEFINSALARYNPEIIKATKEAAIYAADRLSCIKPLSGKSPVEIQREARTAAKTEKKPSIRAQLAQDKEALKNAPKKAAEKTKKQDLERS